MMRKDAGKLFCIINSRRGKVKPMKKRVAKVMALFLAICMVLLSPASVMAADAGNTNAGLYSGQQDDIETSNLQEGDETVIGQVSPDGSASISETPEQTKEGVETETGKIPNVKDDESSPSTEQVIEGQTGEQGNKAGAKNEDGSLQKEQNTENKDTVVSQNEDEEEQTQLMTNKANSYEIDVSKGDVIISDTGVSIGGIPQQDSVADSYILSGTNTSQVLISSNATVIFKGLNLTSTGNPVSIGADVTVLLSETNNLIATERAKAALHVRSGATLKISSISGDGAEDGSLSAFNTHHYNYSRGAGIGTNQNEAGGDIVINGGTIDARGGAGIGGYNPGSITINGGNITALGTLGTGTDPVQYGVGIGSQMGTFKGITIDGGTVNAAGGSGGAGIGTSASGAGGPVVINGGKITANGGYEAAGIGNGQSGTNVDITITGGDITAQSGSRTAIGSGGQNAAADGSVIKISGGTINCVGADVAIGESNFNEYYSQLLVDITGGTFKGAGFTQFVLGKDVSIQNAVFEKVQDDKKGTIRATNILSVDKSRFYTEGMFEGDNGVSISNTEITAEYDKTQKYSPGGIYSFYGEVSLKNNKIGTISSINASGDINIIDSEIFLSHYRNTNLIQSKQAGINISGGKLDMEMGTVTPTSSQAIMMLAQNGDISIQNTGITGAIHGDEEAQKFLTFCNTVTAANSTISSDTQIYAKQKVDISSGYIKSSNTIRGLYCKNIVISGGYHDYAGAVYGHDVLIGTDTGDGNAIIFASEFLTDDAVNSPVRFEKGIIFTNENNPDTPKNGYVYGDVNLNHLIEESGKRFTLPKDYTLVLDKEHKSHLTVEDAKEIINNGSIENYVEIQLNTGSAFTNEADGKVTNHYGGYFVTDGTMKNNGTVTNAVYFSPIKLDDQDWAYYDEDTFKLKNVDDTISYVTDFGNRIPVFYAAFGDNRILLNGKDTGKDINTAWSYLDYPIQLYTIQYDANYKEAPLIEQKEIALADSVHGLEPPVLKRDGYTQQGWNTQADGQGTDVGDSITVNAPTTVYAVWAAQLFTVTFDSQGGSPVTAVQAKIGENIVKPEDPIREGYMFQGWYKEPATENAWDFTADTVNSDLTLYAGWKPIQYEIIFNKNADGAEGSMENQAFTYDEEKKLNENVFKNEGFEFAGWAITPEGEVVYTDKQAVKNLTAEKDGKIYLYAVWNEIGDASYTIEHYKQNKDGTWPETASDKETKSAKPGTTVNGEAKAYNGYVFDSTAEGTAISGEVKADGSLVLKLYYKVCHTVTFDSDGGNYTPDNQSVVHGNKATEPEVPTKEGHTFEGWYYKNMDGEEVKWNFDDVVTGDLKLTAHWKKVDKPVTPPKPSTPSDGGTTNNGGKINRLQTGSSVTKSVKTGDTSNLILLFGLLAGSAAVLTVGIAIRQKKKKSKQ